MSDEQDLIQREAKLKAGEQRLAAREKAISSAPPVKDVAHENALKKRETALNAQAAELAALAQQLTKRQHALKEADAELEEKRKQLNEWETRLTHSFADAERRMRGAAQQMDSARAQARQAEQRLQDAADAERALAISTAREHKKLAERESAFTQSAETRRGELEAQATSLETQRQAQEDESVRLVALEQRLIGRTAPELAAREEAVLAREADANAKDASLESRENVVAETESKQEAERKRLASAGVGIQERDLAVTKRERIVERLVEKHKLADEVKALET